jgi:hypothetical protein
MVCKRILDAKQLEDLPRRKEKVYDFKISLCHGSEKEHEVQIAEPRALPCNNRTALLDHRIALRIAHRASHR